MRVYTRYRSSARRAQRRGAGAFVFVAAALLAGVAWLGWRQAWWRWPRQSSVAFSNHLALQDSLPTNTAPATNTFAPAPSRASNPPVEPAPARTVVQSNAVNSSAVAFNAALAAQVALDRAGISPGSLDGVLGAQTRGALRAFQTRERLPATGELDAETRVRLASSATFTTCRLEAADLARLRPVSATWLGKSAQERLDYENALELVSERNHSNPKLIRQLNSAIDWNAVVPGAELVVPRVERESPRAKAALVEIVLSARTLEVFDAEHRLLAHFPCSIAQRVEKRPVGELRVAVLAPNPNYTFQPEIFPESAEAQEIGRKLVLPPGPNNPVGTVWIGLDKPGYGIHGTPRPEEVGRTESHGCFRLANWNAEFLLQLVSVGTPVQIIP